ncbi:MAG: hypothetical protein FWG10_06825 [Eubacteriaceae bacterium]|nr:hypothetical protein [Eubacteriaceae bacterium]
MEFIVERDLFMSKLQVFLNDRAAEGYKLEHVFVSEQDEREGRNGIYFQASKVTVIMSRQ